LEQAPLAFLFRFEAKTTAPIPVIPGPQGSRMILGVSGGHFAGPKLRGEVLAGQGSEWATLRDDGSMKADVRLVLRTDDGAHLLMLYEGVVEGEMPDLRVTTAPRFEVGDERYRWLNRIQAIAFGRPVEGGIGYDVYQVRWPVGPDGEAI